MNSPAHSPIATLIGEAVILLLQNGRCVTVGNLIDTLEHQRRAGQDGHDEFFRETLTFVRKKRWNETPPKGVDTFRMPPVDGIFCSDRSYFRVERRYLIFFSGISAGYTGITQAPAERKEIQVRQL